MQQRSKYAHEGIHCDAKRNVVQNFVMAILIVPYHSTNLAECE